MTERGTGQTSQQMLASPQGAVFVWPVCSTRDYAVRLARHLGRPDLLVTCPERMEETIRATTKIVVVDHACRLTMRQYEAIRHHHIWRVGE